MKSTKSNSRWTMGIHAVREAIKVRPKAIKKIQVRNDYPSNPDLRTLMEQLPKGLRVEKVSTQVLDKFGQGQGIAAELSESPTFTWDHLSAEGTELVLILDGIQDPHNLGAILRTAWLLGVKVVFISAHRAAPLTATACKVASGGAEHVPVVDNEALPQVIAQLKERNFWIFGLDGAATGTVWNQKFPEKVALVIGSEEKGIRTPVRRACDELISIPQTDKDASFNASVAAGITLAEVRRQHGKI